MSKFIQDLSIPALFAGFITFLIGISVSAILVIQAAQNLGASHTQISSWFLALGLAIGLPGLLLSWKYRYPVATAWSTPGIALILASGGSYNLHEAIGAFTLCGLLIAISGFSGLFQRLLAHIPVSLSCAMLAGILLKFGIHLFASLQNHFVFILSLLIIYLISKRFWPRYNIVIAVLFAALLCSWSDPAPTADLVWQMPQPVWIHPTLSWSTLFGLALPLFVINMTSQNLPGIGMIRSYGFQPRVNSLIGWTGLSQTLFAPFGAFSVNLAAISAAVSLDSQVHPNPNKRYIAGMSSGLCYILMGLFSTTLTSLLMSFPEILITAVAGVALLGTIGHNISLAFADIQHREAALMTFLFSASGVQFWGVGSAFWGLLFGILATLILKAKSKTA